MKQERLAPLRGLRILEELELRQLYLEQNAGQVAGGGSRHCESGCNRDQFGDAHRVLLVNVSQLVLLR